MVRWNGPFGVSSLQSWIGGVLTTFLQQEKRLWIADPKAMNHILKNSVTLYRKPNSMREFAALILDCGLAWAEGNAFPSSAYPCILITIGETHKRQRKAMNPAFGLAEAKELLPHFAQSAAKVRSCFVQLKYCDQLALHTAGR